MAGAVVVAVVQSLVADSILSGLYLSNEHQRSPALLTGGKPSVRPGVPHLTVVPQSHSPSDQS